MEQINVKVGLHASPTVAVAVISPYYHDLLRHNVYPKAAFPYVLQLILQKKQMAPVATHSLILL